MITERATIGKIEVLEDGQLQLRKDTVIERDGEEVTRVYHRRVLAPGDDVSGEPPRVRAIAQVVWTQAVIDAYRLKRAAILGGA